MSATSSTVSSAIVGPGISKRKHGSYLLRVFDDGKLLPKDTHVGSDSPTDEQQYADAYCNRGVFSPCASALIEN